MLNMKHFKLGKKEYVVLDKETLEDILYTTVALTSMIDANANLLAHGCGDPNFSISDVTVGEEIVFYAKHSVSYMTVVDRILENL